MATPVEKFIRETHSRYNVKYALTSEQVRRLRYKLAQAAITGSVEAEDETLARNIILADYGMGSGNLKTASATSTGLMARSVRNAGTCPRCHQGMSFSKLAEAEEIRYCPNCHVCIPVS